MINGDYLHSYRKQGQQMQFARQLSQHFADSPDYQPLAKVNGNTQRLIVSRHKKELTQKDIIAYPGERFEIGDVIEVCNAHWIVTTLDTNTDLYCKGMMEQCTKQIRWQNPKTKQIVERWCMITNPFSTNIDLGNVITTLHGKYEIRVPRDEETLAVPPDTRFMISKVGGKALVYKLTFPDVESESFDGCGKGIIVWNVITDEEKHNADNIDLMIADYIDPQTNEAAESVTYSCIISGKPTVNVGYSRKYTAKFIDARGAEINDCECDWSISPDTNSFVHMLCDGCVCKIEIDDVDEAINTTYNLSCKMSNGNSDRATILIDCVVI